MPWNILLTARAIADVGAAASKLLERAGCKLIHPPKRGPYPAAELMPLLEGIDAVLCSPDKYTAEVLASPEARALKLISRWGVGYDSIDVPAATANGIIVAYVPGLLNNAVADYAFAMLAALARRIHTGHPSMLAGKWTPAWGHDIAHKTLGIIGCGRIGQAMARRAAGFDMQLLGYDVVRNPDAEKLGVRFVSLDELLEQSDFVTLHAALTPETKNLISTPQLKKMKRSAYLINTARGAMIDEAALIQALSEGWIAGAALDAFTIEPMPDGHPFRTTPNLLLTPHQASWTRETGEKVSMASAQAIVDVIEGRRPKNVVDQKVFDAPNLRARL
ncbi:MAG TPA: phosphoglycerate dehydrogenase [Planctomycetota bacterium]|nr:phosphoglycerate dehydrogenase [Planctomycetota bacterium]